MIGNNATSRLAMAVGTVLAIGVAPGLAHAQNAQEEVDKQVTKLIGDAISSRVVARTLEEVASEKNSVWGSYTRLKVDFPGANSRTNVWIAGYDRDITNQWLAGISGSTSNTSGSDADSWSLNPYVAFRFNPNWFVIGTLSYSKTDFGNVPGDSDSWGLGISLNGLHRMNNVLLKGRAGVGWTRSESSITTPVTTIGPPPTFTVTTTQVSSNTTDHTTQGVLDGEAGYFFMPDLYGYAGLQASVADTSNSYQLSARLGLEKRFGKGATFGIKYEQRVDDNSPINIDVWSITAALRIAF